MAAVIIQWCLAALAAVFDKVFTAMPPLPVPAWFTGAGDAISGLFGDAVTMGVWIPIPLALNVALTLFAAMFGGAAIKLARIIASFLTAGGGSAA